MPSPGFVVPRLFAVLAVGAGLLGVASASAQKPRGCVPYLTVVGLQTTMEFGHDLPPEAMTAARVLEQLALDAHIAQRRNVRSTDLIRQPHLTLAVADLKSVRLTPSWALSESIWVEIIEQLTGHVHAHLLKLVRSFSPTTDGVPGRVLTLRARLPAGSTDRPIGALSLGSHHYAMEMRTRIVPKTTGTRTPLLSSRLYRAKCSPRVARAFVRSQSRGAKTFSETAIPGGIADRGYFKADLVAEIAPGGEVEPLYSIFPSELHRLSGTWTYEHDFLTLRILLRPEQLALLQ